MLLYRFSDVLVTSHSFLRRSTYNTVVLSFCLKIAKSSPGALPLLIFCSPHSGAVPLLGRAAPGTVVRYCCFEVLTSLVVLSSFSDVLLAAKGAVFLRLTATISAPCALSVLTLCSRHSGTVPLLRHLAHGTVLLYRYSDVLLTSCSFLRRSTYNTLVLSLCLNFTKSAPGALPLLIFCSPHSGDVPLLGRAAPGTVVRYCCFEVLTSLVVLSFFSDVLLAAKGAVFLRLTATISAPCALSVFTLCSRHSGTVPLLRHPAHGTVLFYRYSDVLLTSCSFRRRSTCDILVLSLCLKFPKSAPGALPLLIFCSQHSGAVPLLNCPAHSTVALSHYSDVPLPAQCCCIATHDVLLTSCSFPRRSTCDILVLTFCLTVSKSAPGALPLLIFCARHSCATQLLRRSAHGTVKLSHYSDVLLSAQWCLTATSKSWHL